MIRRFRRLPAAIVLAAALLAAPGGLIPAGGLIPPGLPGFGQPGLGLPGLGPVQPGWPALSFGPAPVRAATSELTLVSDARYVVQPEKARVHVVVDLTVTNHRPDTTTRRFYYRDAYLAVLPGTTRFSVTAEGATPSVRVRSRTRTYTVLAITFGTDLYSGQSLKLRLQFDLPDPGGPATRDVRIGPSLVTFPVWAFASEGTSGSSVTVTFPPGYAVQVLSGTLLPPTTAANGSTVFRTGPLARPLDFYAYLSADRPAALVSSTLRTTVGDVPVELILRRWAEDPAWATRVGELFRRGLPVLGAAIGLPLPAAGPLIVEESASRTIGGYAGLFDPRTRTIQVAYYADSFVALHEAAHAWFNGRLLADRWANEAFASYYAAEAAAALGVTVRPARLTSKLEKARIPLNAWGAVGREAPDVEDFGYAASLELAIQIGERAGPGSLRAVWAAAAAGEAAYQPVDPARPRESGSGGPPDWRGLLDLLEERTGVGFANLWASWVVRPEEVSLLDARAAARRSYQAAIRAAGDWELSPLIRQAMDAWRYDQAEQLLAQAAAVLEARPSLEAAARAAGLALPSSVRDAFEGPAGPGAALADVQAELVAIGEVTAAASAGERPRDAIETIGLAGREPDGELAAAKAAFAAGDVTGAVERAQAARSTWLGAADAGRTRLISGLLALVVIVGSAILVVSGFVGRRRGPGTGGGPGEPDRYATLAGEPAGDRGDPDASLRGGRGGP